MEYLYTVIDYGSSALKVAFTKEVNEHPQSENPHYFTMSPEVIEVSADAIDKYRSAFIVDPVKYCCVGINDRYYAVGELARQAFRSTLNLVEPKSNYAVQRTLAVVAVAAQLTRTKTSFKLFISCLLPPGELLDKAILEENLRTALKEFKTPTGTFQVNLRYFNCHPEGGGLSLFYESHRGNLEDRSLGVIMMGHRNASCFTVNGKVYQKFRSTDLGFSAIVTDIKEATSAYKDEDLTPAVAKYLLGNEEDKKPLEQILLRNDREMRARELDTLLKAISSAKASFWSAFEQWLIVQFPQIDEIVFGGGVGEIFERQIIAHFDRLPNLPNKDHSGLYLHGGLKYPKDTLIPQELQPRFADVQCLWEQDMLIVAQSYWQNKQRKK